MTPPRQMTMAPGMGRFRCSVTMKATTSMPNLCTETALSLGDTTRNGLRDLRMVLEIIVLKILQQSVR